MNRLTPRPLAFALLLLLFFTVTPALAHASLVSAVPAPGALAPPTLAEIRLIFDERLDAGSTFVVFAQVFQAVEGIAPVVEGDTLRAALSTPLAPSTYTVQWTAVTDDDHSVEGSYQFGVTEPGDAPAPAGQGGMIWVWLVLAGAGLSGAILLAVFVKRYRDRLTIAGR